MTASREGSKSLASKLLMLGIYCWHVLVAEDREGMEPFDNRSVCPYLHYLLKTSHGGLIMVGHTGNIAVDSLQIILDAALCPFQSQNSQNASLFT